MRILLKIAKVLLVLVGLVAALHVVCLLCQRPLVRLIQVDGISMQPTFEPGDRLLFVRRHFQRDSHPSPHSLEGLKSQQDLQGTRTQA